MNQQLTHHHPLRYALFAMTFVVILSNCLVLYPINDWLTWGSFSYPISFLITEMTNLHYGPKNARRVVYVGFAIGILLSIWFSTPKIAFASGSAFLTSQLLDIFIFSKLRRLVWWYAPIFASFAGSIMDASIFWSLAFYGEDLPILTWAIGDTSVKLLLDIAMLTPFRLMLRFTNPQS